MLLTLTRVLVLSQIVYSLILYTVSDCTQHQIVSSLKLCPVSGCTRYQFVTSLKLYPVSYCSHSQIVPSLRLYPWHAHILPGICAHAYLVINTYLSTFCSLCSAEQYYIFYGNFCRVNVHVTLATYIRYSTIQEAEPSASFIIIHYVSSNRTTHSLVNHILPI